MKCREVRMTLVAYLDGEVAPSERTAIDTHLARCKSCEKDLAALGRQALWPAGALRPEFGDPGIKSRGAAKGGCL